MATDVCTKTLFYNNTDRTAEGSWNPFETFEYNLNRFRDLILHNTLYRGSLETILSLCNATDTHRHTLFMNRKCYCSCIRRIVCDLTQMTRRFSHTLNCKHVPAAMLPIALLSVRSLNGTVNGKKQHPRSKSERCRPAVRGSDTPRTVLLMPARLITAGQCRDPERDRSFCSACARLHLLMLMPARPQPH